MFRVSMVIDGEADTAKAALAETAAATRATGEAARAAATPTRALGEAQARAANQSRAMAAAVRPANVQVGLLGAQFNDIGLQLAAGTSPLLVAVQQGTQISQAIGPLGAAGAVRALGAALLSVVNPVSLVTIGAIAAGGALVSMLTGSSDEADLLGGAVDDLKDGVDAFAASAARARQPLAELREEFGAAAERARELFQAQAQLQRLDALESLAGARSLVEEQFGALPQVAAEAVDGVSEAIGELLVLLDESSGKVAKFVPLIRNLEAETGVDGLLAIGLQAQSIAGELDIATEEASELVEALARLNAAEGPDELAAGLQGVAATFTEILGGVENLTPEQREFLAAIQDSELATLQLLGQMEALAGATAGAASEARELARQQRLAAGISGGVEGGRGETLPSRADIIVQSRGGEFIEDDPARRRGARGGAGGARSAAAREAEREAEAIERVFQRLRDERDLLLEADPVQREMIRLRGQLTGATGDQIAALEREIATNLQLEQSLAAQQALFDTLGQTALDALDAIAFGGAKADDVLQGLLRSLTRTVLQATLLGQGPLAGFFGGGGGLLGGIFDAISPVEAAGGGRVRGPGGPSEDAIPARLSDGEFVVNAAATARNLPLLEAINAGIPVRRLADGGRVGDPGFRPPGGTGARAGTGGGGIERIELAVRLSGDLDARIETTSERVSTRITREGIDRFSDSILPVRQREIERTGGIIG